jgi:hypothetical protein
MGKGMLCTYVLFDAASVERNGAFWLVGAQAMPKVHIAGVDKRNVCILHMCMNTLC